MQTLQLVGSAVVALHAAPQNTCTGHMEHVRASIAIPVVAAADGCPLLLAAVAARFIEGSPRDAAKGLCW